MNQEIEKKFLVQKIPENLENYAYHDMVQAYLCTNPVVRVRQEDNDYYLTYKGKGKMVREEYNLPLNKEAFEHLLPKADGNVIKKRRYLIPLDSGLTVELDIFKELFEGFILAEVEFPSVEAADAFTPPNWFSEEVTQDKKYHNSYMSRLKPDDIAPLYKIGTDSSHH
jgi:CYTH domain-containing protein